jgi:hypothetical protein
VWLEQQLEELGGLYNAGVRSANFKQWRQATLTVIQRVWPGNAAKSERFRRIPFGAPTGRPDEREAREYYERGCAEASTYLTTLIREIDTKGLPEERAAERPADLDPGVAEDDFPTVELPPVAGQGQPDASRAASLEAEARSLAEAVAGADDDRRPGDAEDEDAPPPPPPAPEQPPRLHPKPAKSTKKAGARQRLKDMLGFAESQSSGEDAQAPDRGPRSRAENAAPEAAPAEPAPSAGVPRETAPPALAPPAVATPAVAKAPAAPAGTTAAPDASRARPSGEPVAPEAARLEVVMPPEPAAAWERAREEPYILEESLEEQDMIRPDALQALTRGTGAAPEPAPASSPEDVAAAEDATEEFLRTSPVLSPRARPSQPPLEMASSPEPRAMSSAAALAVSALAAEVDRLGVPDGHRARARAALLDLARQLNTRDVTWDALREAVNFVMEFPSLGRRVLPLLLPYLDIAA